MESKRPVGLTAPAHLVGKRWDKFLGQFVPSPPYVEAFLDDIQAVYERHGLFLSHEDTHGGFIIEPLDPDSHQLDWLAAASFTPPAKTPAADHRQSPASAGLSEATPTA